MANIIKFSFTLNLTLNNITNVKIRVAVTVAEPELFHFQGLSLKCAFLNELR